MVATFLMHFNEYEEDVGKTDIVYNHFMLSATEVGLSRHTILDWSAKVCTRFDLLNSPSGIDTVTNPEVIECCQKLGRQVADSQRDILAVKRQLNK
mmetsp:Transcript_10788/g.16569  ORF Transcript_10788/g.16569 Transcript_10788/m.16569 type:complete len:96 (-) Transcript_10788:756-1043(-)